MMLKWTAGFSNSRMMLLCASLLPLCLVLFSYSGLSTAKPTVTIADGSVVGTTTRIPGASSTVNKFLGIPFAVSPPKRFFPPASPKKWKKALDATQFKPACMQQFNYPETTRNFTISVFSSPNPPESEDCLYLNVFVPAKKSKKGGRAVMFWLYGGSLKFGTGGLWAYDGSSFAANQDVIVVTTNYRTNAFGFPNAPEQKQNLGFLDQRKALDWVQQNIAAFGGDPKKVTIFGESAGGYSVKQLLTFPPSPLNFRAAIIESPGAGATGDGAPAWVGLVAGLNCTTAESQFDCVKKASATDIKSVIEHGALTFAPVNDNTTHSSTMAAAVISRKVAPVPILIGTNADEGSFYTVSVTDFSAFLQANFPNQTAVHAALTAAYPLSVYGTAARAASAVFTDLAMTCPVSKLANLGKDNGYSMYRYYFNASFPNFQPFPGAGAWHSSEIQEVFGTYIQKGATAQQIALSKVMQTAWADFAKDPNAGPGWSKLGTKMVDFGSNGSHKGKKIEQAVIDRNCALFSPLIVV
ncbi:hypothetical protein HGRIS_005333 [Hohenbuehelia grisea]|uniref:Carboxylic ester hydrolase n=1 Tax=Hohenbuehelia grisea TaxID=104357 RepID=A0ABR3JGB9_9AGAR